jgi:hypothetical protein
MKTLTKALTLWVGLNAVAGAVFLLKWQPQYGAISILSTIALVVALLLPEYRRAKT